MVVPEDDGSDTVDVPAAVVCAHCGRPECPGCHAVEETTQPSGIVAIVPWERPGMSGWSRLWNTVNVASLNADAFCASLPSGGLAAPLRFAFICELLAVSSLAMVCVALGVAVFPSLALGIVHNAVLRSLVLRVFVVAVPALSAILVLGHLVLGLGFDIAATRTGSRSARARALRFGLYSTGWDLLRSSPLGLGFLLFEYGPARSVNLLGTLLHVPTRGSHAFLRGTYHLEGKPLFKVANFGVVASLASSVAAVLVLFVLLALVALVPV